MKYKASSDWLTITITLLVFAMVIAVGIGHFMENSYFFSRIKLPIPSVILFLLIIGATYLYSPKYYKIENGNVIIVRPLGNIKILLVEITSAGVTHSISMLNTYRTFGSGGLFGYFGKCWNKEIGEFKMYATQRKNMILIVTSTGKKFVITPDDLKLLDEIKSHMPWAV